LEIHFLFLEQPFLWLDGRLSPLAVSFEGWGGGAMAWAGAHPWSPAPGTSAGRLTRGLMAAAGMRTGQCLAGNHIGGLGRGGRWL